LDETPASFIAALATGGRAMTHPISYSALQSALGEAAPPLLIDVRRRPAFMSATEMIAGALRRDPQSVAAWGSSLPGAGRVVVYCVHGHEVSQGAARALREQNIEAWFLEGGIEEGWKGSGGAVDPKPAEASTRWVTRERPRIDRIACPWLVSRFVDRDAEFLYVPSADVRDVARDRNAVPYDIPDVRFSHEGALCSFDAFLAHYRLTDPALKQLAAIVRGADTGDLDAAPQSAGLLAISLGLSRNFSDDSEMLSHGCVMYDALYAWCKEGRDEVHTWNPEAYR
jgi:rhodanese-related sulfurtransferase